MFSSHNAPATPGRRVCFYTDKIMSTEAEVLTGHNELIYSPRIERITAGGDAALNQIGSLQ